MTDLKERLHATYSYDTETGYLTRISGRYSGVVQKVVASNGYLVTYFEGRNVKVHRVVWAMHNGRWPDDQIDHIDGNKQNNLISNLRQASQMQNAKNHRSSDVNTCKPKGIWINRHGKFCADIYADGERVHLGSHQTIDEAAHAYNKAAIRLHGEFACLNPIGGDK